MNAENVSRDVQSSLTRVIARFVSNISYQALPQAIQVAARQHFLDTIGCCLASVGLDTSKDLAQYFRLEGGAKQATVVGHAQRLSVTQAAFLNGALARSLEFDDMAMPDLHPSGVIVPVVLALTELQKAATSDLLSAVGVGLELILRIGRAAFDSKLRNSGFLNRGQDASAICGTVAGAAVAAKLLQHDEDGIANAMGIAVSLASGSLECNRSGGTIKRLQSGWAAQSAARAAFLAKAGISGHQQFHGLDVGRDYAFSPEAFDGTSRQVIPVCSNTRAGMSIT